MKKLVILLVMLLLPVLAQASSYTLSWTDNSVNEAGFKIERRAMNPDGSVVSDFTEVGQVDADITTYKDTTPNEQVYCYRVKAFNIVGESAYTNEDCGTGPIGAPGQLTVTFTLTVVVSP